MDIDGDGFADVLSGSWPGELFLFKGGPDHAFAAGEMLKDKAGQLINVGGGIQEKAYRGNGTLIRGAVEWETTSEGRFAIYRGQRIKVTPDKPVASTGTASTVHPVDWDGDGDLDLIVGEIRGNVWLVPNEGTAKSYAFGKETQLKAGGKLLTVGSRAGPYAADWDGDGDLDLLVGDDDGRVSLFRNTGSAKSPELAAAVVLVPEGKADFGPQASKEVVRGTRSKVCVADWNGDGRPDLLVGDLATVKPERPAPTAEEQAEFDRVRKELEPIQQRYSELGTRLNGPSPVQDEAERKKLEEEFTQVRLRMNALRSRLPQEYETHGWVWLFLRK